MESRFRTGLKNGFREKGGGPDMEDRPLFFRE